MAETSIAWTQAEDGSKGYTFNPWIGCSKVSEGCKNCYAETFTNNRMGLKLWRPEAARQVTSADNWRGPRRWHRKALADGVRRRVFCASLADVFEDRPELLEPRARLFRLIEETPGLDWQLLTKRPENMRRLAEAAGWAGAWPGHVWAGCTVESQRRANERIPILAEVPASVRFLSVEPLLEALELRPLLSRWQLLERPLDKTCLYRCGRCGRVTPAPGKVCKTFADPVESLGCSAWSPVSWVIVGGESGPGARLFDLAWARSLRGQCAAAGVAFFMKQLGSRVFGEWGPGKAPLSHTHPSKSGSWVINHRNGENPAEWPEDLRVREWPRRVP